MELKHETKLVPRKDLIIGEKYDGITYLPSMEKFFRGKKYVTVRWAGEHRIMLYGSDFTYSYEMFQKKSATLG